MTTALIENNVAEAFNAKHAVYGKTSHAEFLGEVESLFASLGKKQMNVGLVMAGQTGISELNKFIVCWTKVGLFMLYEKDGVIHYSCEQQYAECASSKAAGFGRTSGVVDTIEKLNHVFMVFDSYL